MAAAPHVSHSRNPGIQRSRTLLQVIASEPDIRKRRAALAARAAGNFGATFRGGSVLGDRAAHGGFVSVASGGTLKNAARATKTERDAWMRKAHAGKLIVLSAAEKKRLGIVVPKRRKPVTAATIASRRTRAAGRIAPTAAAMARVDARPRY